VSTFVLLRGLMREQRHWGAFPAALQAALPGARIFAPDFPGNGTRHAEPSATRVDAMVQACRASLREQGAQGPFHVVALSLGAMVAVEWAARYPAELAAATLVNTSMRPFSRFHQRLRWPNYPAILKLALLGGALRQEATILRLTSNRHANDAALLQRWVGFQKERPVRRSNAIRQLLAAARYRAPLVKPAVPIQLLASAADRLVDPACSAALARAWNVSCARHSGAGHDLPLDECAWVVDRVAKWHGPIFHED
jgi:pimeloyl-ACP methyl ester carboxylesterase